MSDKTISERISQDRITMTCEETDHNPNMADSDSMDHWRCVLRQGRKRLTITFSMGVGHHGKEPECADVLDCLLSDASGVENARGFEDWCSDYGYDTDSRTAERTFKAVERSTEKLKRFLNSHYEAYLFHTERL